MQPCRQFDMGVDVDAGRTDAAVRRAAPGRSGRGHGRPLAAARAAAGLLAAFTALLALPLQAQDYTPLAGLRVSDGRVQYLGFSSQCINLSSSINGVVYTTHTSKWQRRAGASWVDIPGTERDGLCSYSPTSPGEYRLVAEITIGGVRGRYSSENTLTVEGTTAPVTPPETGTVGVESFEIPNLGGRSVTSNGTEAATRSGYGRIRAEAGSTTPSGIAIFGFRPGGVLVAEAGVPATEPVQEGRIFAEVRGPVNTGLAIANPNDRPATILFHFRDAEGVRFGDGQFELGAHEQTAKFLNQEPFNSGEVSGTFTFTSSESIAVVALRGLTNRDGEFLMTTLPVAPLASTSTDTVYFPHFTDGSGWVTQVILVNPTDETIAGTIQFVDQGSATADAAPATLTLDDGRTGSEFSYSIPAGGSQRFTTSNPTGGATTGSVRATPDEGSVAPSGLVVFSFTTGGKTVSEVGVNALTAGSAFRLYAESSGTPGQAGSIRTGLAITNAADTDNMVTLEVTSLDGKMAMGVAPVTLPLPPSGQVARFLDEIFGSLPGNFSGVLRVTSMADVAIVGLRLRINERGELKMTTTPPSDETGPATMVDRFFPHIVDSAGWSTQFILFSGTAGQASSGTLSFIDTAGEPWDLPTEAVQTADTSPSFGTATVSNTTYTVGTAISALALPAASGGDGSLTYSLSPSVPGLSFNATTRVLAGTPTSAGSYGMTYTVRDADGDIATLNFVVTVATTQMTTVDLVVTSVSASDDTLEFGQSFDLTATVRNAGTGASTATTLRFYRSTDTTISTGDTEVGTDAVDALAAAGASDESISLTAPSTAGTYYYGACVDPVSGESNSRNNCSTAVRVTVSASQIGSSGFDLANENGNPEGIVFANDRFYVVDREADKVFAYQSSGQRDSTSDFDLDSDIEITGGITFANGRFYVANFSYDKVYAYQSSGQRDSASDFDLAGTGWPGGITFANDRFYVVDNFDDKVYAYHASGERDSVSDFDLDSANRDAEGIAFANETFYVVDDRDGIYAYHASGERDSASDFDLNPDNDDAGGITFANDRFYVVDSEDYKVYAYSAAGAAPGTTGSQPSFGTATVSNTTYTAGTAIRAPTLPAASGGDGSLTYSLSPAVPGLSFNTTTRVLAGTPTVAGTYNMTYTVRDADGDIATLNFIVTVATTQMTTVDLVVTTVSVSSNTPMPGQSFDLRATVRNAGTGASTATTLRYYRSSDATISMGDTEVGTDAVGALAAAGASDESIGLTAPSTAGTYYYGVCVDPVSGESNSRNNCSSAVRVTVSASQIGSSGFDLDNENGSPEGIAFANNRFYVVDWFDDKVYAYQATGQRDSASDFDLDSATGWARGIAFANNRFYVVDWSRKEVHAYQATGQRDSASDFDLESDNDWPGGITFANDRFYVVDNFDDKVYAYQATGQRDSASDFDLDSANRRAEGIAFANDSFYVIDDRDGIYAYQATGQRDSASDFDLNPDNDDARGITFANDRFYVVDEEDDKVYAYSAAGAAPGTTGSQPSFGTATVSNRTYTAGAAISVLTLPAASGGDGTLTYSLSPTVSGLTFSSATRQLTGTPSTAGTYAVTYTVIDDDGDSDTLSFTITVAASGSFAPADEQAFNSLVVGNRLNAEGFYIDFPSAGRFLESGSLPGSYSYASTGSDTGTMTLTYDGGNYGGSCTLLLTFVSATTGTLNYTCASGIQSQGSWTITASDVPPLGFSVSGSATRSIPENLPGGINVGVSVSAVGGDRLTYSIGGVDAQSFDIVTETGQIRTKDGVAYDYETKNRYLVEVTVADDADNRESIDVTIDLLDLTPICNTAGDLRLRINSTDRRLTARWNALPDTTGYARVLGYQTEIRRGSTGPWTDRRMFLGPAITGATYANLDNEIGYQVRVRSVNAEGDCGWSTPVSGIPTGDLAPRDEIEHVERFGPHPIGTDERNFRLLTPGRCRHTASGVHLDADCSYERTSPDTGRITLEFDDPSRGSCDVTLAYSSLTAGSFIDECFDAGVDTNVPFDRSFRMPRLAPRTEDDLDPPTPETTPQRAPRTQEEFDELVFGRDDFIPGLCFGSCIFGNPPEKGVARVFSFDDDGIVGVSYGDYTYEKTGPSQGVVTLTTGGGEVWTFTLDFEPWGNVRATIVDSEGGTAVWPGTPHVDLALGAQPILLPIPPSWSAAIAVEADYARVESHASDIENELLKRFFPDLTNLVGGDGDINYRRERAGLGRNRFAFVVSFPRLDTNQVYGGNLIRKLTLNGSEWTFVVTITSDGWAEFSLTVTKEGELPRTGESFVDFTGEGIDLDEFPEELLLPDEPPQASAEDAPGLEVAAAVSATDIGSDDQQVLLVSAAGGNYQPGDWLEPKDGGNQRMMIVSTGPPTSVAASVLAPRSYASNGMALAASAPQFHAPGGSVAADFKTQADLAPYMISGFNAARTVQTSAVVSAATDGGFVQLNVVCMQFGHDIPTRGARYFSVANAAEGPVETCQKQCVLNESANIQSCVWQCEQ